MCNNVNVPNATLILLKCFIILCVFYNDLNIKENPRESFTNMGTESQAQWPMAEIPATGRQKWED